MLIYCYTLIWTVRSLLSISLMVEIVGLMRKEIDKPKPDVSDIMLATIINLARVEVCLCTLHNYCLNAFIVSDIYSLFSETPPNIGTTYRV